MSDHSISIVPKKSVCPDKENKAKEILEWLISRDIVKPVISDCILGADGGYAISHGAKLVCPYPKSLPFDLITNGLEIITERNIFDAGENGLEELICPECKQGISAESLDFLNDWADNKSNNIICPLCNVGTDIHQFQFTPEWGFSDLGFRFWNWPELTADFIEEFRQRLGGEVSVVYGMI